MKTTNTHTNILAALLITSTLVVSGCAQTTAPIPSVKMETKFQHNIGSEHIKNAIVSAATENGWKVVESGNTNDLILKKSISFKETAKNTRGRIWNKVTVTKDAYANVSLTQNSYALDLSSESQKYLENYYSSKTITADLKELKKSIHCALIPEAL
ncbi:MAG: hypothetical protein JXQ67_03940 [Campylobacterales bacterium]|nr:hypothetical protein [Campylobacterales bacterium]